MLFSLPGALTRLLRVTESAPLACAGTKVQEKDDTDNENGHIHFF